MEKDDIMDNIMDCILCFLVVSCFVILTVLILSWNSDTLFQEGENIVQTEIVAALIGVAGGFVVSFLTNFRTLRDIRSSQERTESLVNQKLNKDIESLDQHGQERKDRLSEDHRNIASAISAQNTGLARIDRSVQNQDANIACINAFVQNQKDIEREVESQGIRMEEVLASIRSMGQKTSDLSQKVQSLKKEQAESHEEILFLREENRRLSDRIHEYEHSSEEKTQDFDEPQV